MSERVSLLQGERFRCEECSNIAKVKWSTVIDDCGERVVYYCLDCAYMLNLIDPCPINGGEFTMPQGITIKGRMLSLFGKRSRKLVALYPVDRGESGHVLWYCRCDCGTFCKAKASDISRGLAPSCGCSKPAAVVVQDKPKKKKRRRTKKEMAAAVFLTRHDPSFAANPAAGFIEIIRALFLTGHVHACMREASSADNCSGEPPGDSRSWGWWNGIPQGECAGWLESDSLYVDYDRIVEVAEDHAYVLGSLMVTLRQLSQKLIESDYLLSTEDGTRCTTRRMLDGRRRRVLHLRASLEAK